MIVTASAEMDARLRRLRQHGMSVPDTVRHSSSEVVFEKYPELGFNYRLTDIQAAIGREQLTRLAGIVLQRRLLAERYRAQLSGIPGVLTPSEPTWARTNWQTFAVRLRTGDQRTVMQRMLDAGVSTRRGVMNAHLESAYPPGTFRTAGALVHGEQAQNTTIVLPLYHQMSLADQDRVVASLIGALE